jgi:propionyl-CoA carboxylase beta chain
VKDLLDELERREARADEGGGAARQERQARLGRLTARQRIAALVDAGSFVELGRHVVHRQHDNEALEAHRHPGDGVVCGAASVGGRSVAVIAHDPTVLRGAIGHEAAKKMCRLLDLAGERGLPVVTLADCDGARVAEGIDAIDGNAEVIRRTVLLKSRVPQITLACGLCVGAAAYTATLTDWVGMVEGQSFMFITGAKVVRVITGEEVEIDDLGGPAMHASVTGACHAVLKSEDDGIAWVKRILGYLDPVAPSDDPPTRETPEIETLVPESQRRAYDMKKVIATIFDRGSAFELGEAFAPNLLTFLARLGGRAVCVVASQPTQLGGCIDVDASRKGAAFVAWANRMRIPVVTLVDVPGYLPGKKQEQGGIIPHGATLLTAYAEATVPLVCLVVRKCFGGATVLSFGADVRFALPTARIAPMGADATVEVTFGPPATDATPEQVAAHDARKNAWLAAHDHAWAPAEQGYVDQVLRPRAARSALATALVHLCSTKA